jgi:hypothetical protein
LAKENAGWFNNIEKEYIPIKLFRRGIAIEW